MEQQKQPNSVLGKKILIAEDEKPLAKVLSLKLVKAGFDVDIAYDGEEAIKLIGENTYDLIITDLIMPKVDGFKILEEMKSKGIATPVIVTSNLSQEEDEKKSRALGARDYFVKSNTPIIKIIDNVKKILEL